MSNKIKGKVKFFNIEKGFGFITSSDYDDNIFFHISNLKDEDIVLYEGDPLLFVVNKGKKGYEATNIEYLGNKVKGQDMKAFGPKDIIDRTLKISKLDHEEYDEYLEICKEYVKKFKGEVTTTKLRKLFSSIQVIDDLKKVKSIRPQLAYEYGREEKRRYRELLDLLDELIKSLSTKEELENFKEFMEILVAYNRYFESK